MPVSTLTALNNAKSNRAHFRRGGHQAARRSRRKTASSNRKLLWPLFRLNSQKSPIAQLRPPRGFQQVGSILVSTMAEKSLRELDISTLVANRSFFPFTRLEQCDHYSSQFAARFHPLRRHGSCLAVVPLQGSSGGPSLQQRGRRLVARSVVEHYQRLDTPFHRSVSSARIAKGEPRSRQNINGDNDATTFPARLGAHSREPL